MTIFTEIRSCRKVFFNVEPLQATAKTNKYN